MNWEFLYVLFRTEGCKQNLHVGKIMNQLTLLYTITYSSRRPIVVAVYCGFESRREV